MEKKLLVISLLKRVLIRGMILTPLKLVKHQLLIRMRLVVKVLAQLSLIFLL